MGREGWVVRLYPTVFHFHHIICLDVFNPSLLPLLARRNWKGKVGRAQEKAAAQQQQQHRRGSAAAQRAMEVADKLEARVGGGNYRQAVKDAKRKARRRVEY